MASPEQTPLVDRPDRKALLIGRGDKFTKEMGGVLLDLTGVGKPNVLVLTTPASNPTKHEEYLENYRDALSERAHVESMHDFITDSSQAPSDEEVADRIGRADAILISGGNSTKAREIFVNSAIGQAIFDFDGVVAGGSTGAIMQATEALSWSTPDAKHQELNEWIAIDGLRGSDGRGMVNAIVSPHLDYIEDHPGEDHYRGERITQPRSHYFRPFLESRWNLPVPGIPQLGLGIDDASAIAFMGESFRVFSQGDAGPLTGVSAYSRRPSGLTEARFTPASTPDFVPTSTLVQ